VVHLGSRPSQHLYERLTASEELTVSARIRPESLGVSGPARIVSFSRDTGHRNFTVGQDHSNIVFRVRTPFTGLNGSYPEVQTLDSPLTMSEHWIDAAYDGESSLISIDGVCSRAVRISWRTVPPLIRRMLAMTIMLCTALGGLALASVAWTGSMWLRGSLLCAGGAATWGVLWLTGTWAHVSSFQLRAVALGLAAIAAAIPLLGMEADSSARGTRRDRGMAP
jgi:hypothetical protein